MSSVFPRGRGLKSAVDAAGCWVIDHDGRRFLDAAGGAIVSSVGHGRREVIDAIAAQLGRVDYVHSSVFTTDVLEEYAGKVAARAPMSSARVYPVSGGSEAMETALKMARAYQLARGEDHRHTVLGRWGSYHGNTRGALAVSGRVGLRSPYLPWLGQTGHVPAVYEYRCPAPDHPRDCGAWHARQLEAEIDDRGDVAAFVAEAVGGATLGAAVPPADYWPAVAEVCKRRGVLLIVDEVMSGFGRTGTWFGIEHWGVTPDLIVAGKGASSGYWPLGLCIASGPVFDTIGENFVHGFTYSHHPAGAAAGLAVMELLETEDLVSAAALKGELLRTRLTDAIGDHPLVGDIRGLGLLVAVELVADRPSKRPFDRSSAVTESLLAAARDAGLLLYPASKGVDGVNGDAVLMGPPLIIDDDEIDQVATRLATALSRLGV